MRNYDVLSSFNQMIIITFIHFTILLLAFYLDLKKTFHLGEEAGILRGLCSSCPASDYATAMDTFCSIKVND